MTQVKKAVTPLQTASTIRLGVYYLLHCEELTNNNYILKWNNNYNFHNIQLFEIAEENKEKNMLSVMEVGGVSLKNIKTDHDSATNIMDILRFKKENETEILKKLTNYYLNPKHCSKWNELIGDFYAANFYAFDNINYLMPTKLKLKKWVSSREILVKYINDSQIANNINELALHIKNVKGCIRGWFLKLQNIPFFTAQNSKKQKVEHLILEHEYNDALNMLSTTTDNDRYYPYYKHIYSIICYQQLYKQENDIRQKKRYFLKMIELLEAITRFMVSADSLTCSLFADILLNYNPNKLTSNDWIFISNMVVSGCCFMIGAKDIYNICGSIHSYLFLLFLIENHKLAATLEIQRVILKNMDELFNVYDGDINIKKTSEWYNIAMVRHKTLWKVKKQKILQCESDSDGNDKRNDVLVVNKEKKEKENKQLTDNKIMKFKSTHKQEMVNIIENEEKCDNETIINPKPKQNKSMKNEIVKHENERNIISIIDDSDSDIEVLTNIKQKKAKKNKYKAKKSKKSKKSKNNKSNKNNKNNKCINNVIIIIDDSGDSDDEFILKLLGR